MRQTLATRELNEARERIANMQSLLVVGPEAGGTKLLTGLLSSAGTKVQHCSPMYRLTSPQWLCMLPDAEEFDKIVVVLRHGPWRERAAMDSGHVPPDHPEIARWWAAEGLRRVLNAYIFKPVFIVTLEAVVYEKDKALAALFEDLELNVDASTMRAMCEEIGNPNSKWWGGEHFRDERETWERG